MKNFLILTVYILLFSCKGNGQNTNPLKSNDISDVAISDTENQVVFSGDYNDLLTLKMASQITGLDISQVSKTHTMKGLLAETLRFYWENGREVIVEGSTFTSVDRVQLNWVDGEADMESFLSFIELKAHPELLNVAGVGESAYWNSKKIYLEVYYHGMSFRLEVDISNDENLDKEKTIALAKQIIEEKMK